MQCSRTQVICFRKSLPADEITAKNRCLFQNLQHCCSVMSHEIIPAASRDVAAHGMAGNPAGLTGCDRQHLAKIFTYLTQILAISSNQGARSQVRLTDGCEFTEDQHPAWIWNFLVLYLVLVLPTVLLCPAPRSQHFLPAVSSETGWLSFLFT